MKVAIPSMGERGLEEQVGDHFGRSPFYTIVDSKSNEVTVLPNTGIHLGGNEHPAVILSDKGVDVMLCGTLGVGSIDIFEERGVRVYVGAEGTIKDAIEAFKNNKLNEITDEDVCRSYEFQYHGLGGVRTESTKKRPDEGQYL